MFRYKPHPALCCMILLMLLGNGRAAEKPAVILDGVYGLDGGRILRIEGEHFEIFCDAESIPGRSRVSGVFSVDDNQTVEFRYFNGQASVVTRVSYAVIGGHLWIDILHRRHDELWAGTAIGFGLLDPLSNGAPEGEVEWNIDKGIATFGSRHRVEMRALAAGPARVYPGMRRIFAVAGGLAAEDDLAALNLGHAHGEIDQIRIHWAALTLPNPLSNKDDPQLRLERIVPRLDSSDDDLYHLGQRFSRWASYEILDDAMVAPWSVDLGPIGLVPVKAAADKMIGIWPGPGNKNITVSERVVGINVKPVHPRPDKKGILALESELAIGPEDRNIFTKTYGWNCMANHGDHTGYVYWFFTSDDKLINIIYPAYCDGGSGSQSQIGRLEKLSRAKPEK